MFQAGKFSGAQAGQRTGKKLHPAQVAFAQQGNTFFRGLNQHGAPVPWVNAAAGQAGGSSASTMRLMVGDLTCSARARSFKEAGPPKTMTDMAEKLADSGSGILHAHQPEQVDGCAVQPVKAGRRVFSYTE